MCFESIFSFHRQCCLHAASHTFVNPAVEWIADQTGFLKWVSGFTEDSFEILTLRRLTDSVLHCTRDQFKFSPLHFHFPYSVLGVTSWLLLSSNLPLSLCTCSVTTPSMDFDLCTSDSGDGCGGSFTFKTSPGLCAKCQKLATLKPDSEEYVAWTVGILMLLPLNPSWSQPPDRKQDSVTPADLPGRTLRVALVVGVLAY